RGSILAIVRMGSKDLELNNGRGGQPGRVVPAQLEEPVNNAWRAALRQKLPVQQTAGEQPSKDQLATSDATPAQYCEGGDCYEGGGACMNGGGSCMNGGCMNGGGCYGSGAGGCMNGGGCYGSGGGGCYGNGYGDGSMANMPMGMPTSGFAPMAVPPN